MEGASAKELNRTLLSALRKVEKRTTLRAEWTSDDGTSERFFDYVLKTQSRVDLPLGDYVAGSPPTRVADMPSGLSATAAIGLNSSSETQ
jgi:hypothetical protein